MNFLTGTGRRQSYTLYLHKNPIWTPCHVYKALADISQWKPQQSMGQVVVHSSPKSHHLRREEAAELVQPWSVAWSVF